MKRPKPLRPDRKRTMEKPFGWVPFRILTSGLLTELTPSGKLLYFFLCLVADRYGVSFYGQKRLIGLLGLPEGEFARARTELCRFDLLAFDGRVYQVLSLPEDVYQGNQTGQRRRTMQPVAGREPQSVGRILRQLGFSEGGLVGVDPSDVGSREQE